MNKSVLSLAAIALLVISCQSVEQDVCVTAPEIIASVETQTATKTLIEVDELGEGTIYWTPADQINIFYGTFSTHYTSQNIENATTAVFRTTDIIGSTESESTNIWGLYPYDENATCDGTKVTTTLPAAQYGVQETFDDDLFITLAHSTTNALKFFNVCGGIKFSLSRDDISSITFRGNNDESIAGDISLTFENGLPKATVVNGLKEITLTPKTGETFAQGVNYYLIVLPGTLSGGFTMTFTTSSGSVGTFNYSANLITIKRSVFSKKAEIDTYATFDEVDPVIPNDFNPDTFLVYRANKTEYTSGRDWYSIESHMPGISGAKVEMKFQLAEGTEKTLACDNRGSDYSYSKLEIKNGNIVWFNWDEDDDECFSYQISLNSCGLSETDLIILLYDSVNSTFTLNNYSQTCQLGEMSFGNLFAEYYSESDEGRRTAYTGVPEGSKLYYVKVWDENDTLTYLGYATVSVNPSTNQTEYCWCSFNPLTNVSTYDFANDAIHQGGYSGNTQPMVPEAVDLGLSVKWASFNLGASAPEEYGDYYAWGETSTKDYFAPTNYKFYPNGDSYTVSKYIVPDQIGYDAWGTPDYNNVLDSEDDAASVVLGEGWRIPTMEDFQELLDNCSWIPYEYNEVKGYLVISNVEGYQNNSIFLPANERDESMNGDGIYWTSVLCSRSHGGIGLADCAGTFDVMRSPSYDNYGFIGHFRQRHDGYYIRPVLGEPAKDAVEVISCIPSSITIHVGEEVQLSATVLPVDAEYDGFDWTVTGGTPYISVTNNGTVKGLRKGNGYVESRIGYVYSGCSVTVLDSAEPANCHILKTGSEAYIQTVKGNSTTSVGNVASAEVLWETFNSDIEPTVGDIIATIELKGGVVFVKSGNHEGNAVIAVKDSDGHILWSWHIWVTNQNIREVTYSKNAGILMDRNVGSINDCGLLFQWGRKDPFLHDYTSSIDYFASTITWPSNVTSSVGGTITYSISHPTTLIRNNTIYSSDWLSDTNNSLWGDEKTIYDPCPAGWKVPKGGPEGVWVIAGFPSYDVTSSGNAPNESPYNTYGPTSGSEDTRSADYWSSTAYDSTKSYGLYRTWFWSDDGDADHFTMNPSARLSKQSLGAVRCIKEDL